MLQRNFYLTITAVPVVYALYAFTTNDPGAAPLFTRMINYYSQYEERWKQRNTLHTAMIEQAAFDRNLFQNSERNQMIDLKFPEYILPSFHNPNLLWTLLILCLHEGSSTLALHLTSMRAIRQI